MVACPVETCQSHDDGFVVATKAEYEEAEEAEEAEEVVVVEIVEEVEVDSTWVVVVHLYPYTLSVTIQHQ